MFGDPRILVLDEPCAGLDLPAREALIAAIDRASRERPDLCLLLATHHLEEIPTSATHAALLRDRAAGRLRRNRRRAHPRASRGVLRRRRATPERALGRVRRHHRPRWFLNVDPPSPTRRLGGAQDRYAPGGCVGLWSRADDDPLDAPPGPLASRARVARAPARVVAPHERAPVGFHGLARAGWLQCRGRGVDGERTGTLDRSFLHVCRSHQP